MRWRAMVVAAGLVSLAACDGPVEGMDAALPTTDTGPSFGDAGPPGDGGPGDAGVDAGPIELEPDTDIGDPLSETWIYMQSHLHTTGFHACANSPLDPGTGPESACYSAEGITAFLDDALANGASDMIITDHTTSTRGSTRRFALAPTAP